MAGDSFHVQLKKGVLELCVLALLSQRDNYAYEIANLLAQAIDMGEGSIYPLMRRMQNEALVDTYLVDSQSGPPRRYYRLTKTGRATLAAQEAEWRMFAKAVDGVIGGGE